jgi:hypothetical protein
MAAWAATADAATGKAEYDRRNAERYRGLFAWLDTNGDRVVTAAEAHGDLDFGVVFDDMDIDRDGRVTERELNRHIEQRFGSH